MEQWEGGLLSLYFVHITAEYIPLDDDGIITYMPRQGSFLTVKYITMESYIITRKKPDSVLLVSKYVVYKITKRCANSSTL